jgi:undecaprenyl-diphosphatase
MFANEEIAAASTMLLNIYPLTMAGTLIITPDVPTFMFFGLSVYTGWMAIKSDNVSWWYWTGLFYGLSMASKYTAVMFGPLFLLFIIISGERKRLLSIHPYLALVLSAVVFSPVLFWNMDHGWISFKFQLGHGLGGESYSLSRMLEFVGSQLLVVSPFVFIPGIIAVFIHLFSKSREKTYLSVMCVPIILFFTYSSLKKHAEANWTALAYFTFTVSLCQHMLSGSRMKRVLFLLVFLSAFGMSMLATVHTRFGVLNLSRFSKNLAETDATNWFYGYRKLGAEIAAFGNPAFIMTTSHQLSAEITYYTHGIFPVLVDEKVTRPSQYNLWKKPDIAGKDGLYIFSNYDASGDYHSYFSSIIGIKKVEVFRNGFMVRVYTMIFGKSYNGQK